MKWFKHMSDLPRDEGVSRYLDAAESDRVTAYGFLMFLLEAIASRMAWGEDDLTCSATYSISHWGHITYSHPNRVRKYLGLCKVIGWVLVEFEGGMCKVEVPRMVQWRDEYTRKSGQTPDNVAQSRADQSRTDQKESRDDGSLSGGLAKRTATQSPPHGFNVTDEMKTWAVKRRPDVDIDAETEKFMLYEFSKPFSNWVPVWKKWIVGADKHRPGRRESNAQYDSVGEMQNLAQLLGLAKNERESESDYLNRVERANLERIRNLDG